MLELRIKAAKRRYVAPEALRAEFGVRRAKIELADMIEALMLQLDMIDGDPDLENDTSDFEESGDEKGDPAWCEWHTLPAPTRKVGRLNTKPLDPMRGTIQEDDEDDDDDACSASEDNAAIFSQGHKLGFGWCRSAHDPDCEPSGDEKDTSNAEDEHLTEARLLADDTAWTALDRGIFGGGSDQRPGMGDRQLELNDN